MLKLNVVTACLLAALTAPVLAQETMMNCDEASIAKMQSDMDAMADPAMKDKKEMAMNELSMAKDSMSANRMGDCKSHMENAAKSMGKM